jgi:hypothetical protein
MVLGLPTSIDDFENSDNTLTATEVESQGLLQAATPQDIYDAGKNAVSKGKDLLQRATPQDVYDSDNYESPAGGSSGSENPLNNVDISQGVLDNIMPETGPLLPSNPAFPVGGGSGGSSGGSSGGQNLMNNQNLILAAGAALIGAAFLSTRN